MISSFSGDGSFAIGITLKDPTVQGTYRYSNNTLLLLSRTGGKEVVRPTWSDGNNRFEYRNDKGTLFRSRRRPVKALIRNVVQEHNAMKDGQKGIALHVHLEVHNAPRLPCTLVALFGDSKGNPIKARNRAYQNVEGFMVTHTPLNPPYPETVFKDLVLFMPYSEFTQPTGKHELRFVVSVLTLHNGKLVVDKPVVQTFNFVR
jgi:hypothetical protein